MFIQIKKPLEEKKVKMSGQQNRPFDTTTNVTVNSQTASSESANNRYVTEKK